MSTDLRREFPLPAFEDWRKAAERLLKGAPFEKVLLTETYEGITLQPIYENSTEPSPEIPARPQSEVNYPWEIAAVIPYPSVNDFNAALKEDLRRGQTTVVLRIDQAGVRGLDRLDANEEFVGEQGTSVTALTDLETALNGIDLRLCPIRLEAGNSTSLYLPMVAAWAEKQGIKPEELHGAVGMDPLGAAVFGCPLPREWAFGEQAEMLRWVLEHHSPLRVVRVSSLPYAEAGASAVEEIAYVIAGAVETLNRLTDAGFKVDDICRHLEFVLSVGPNFFMEIAKFRALRQIWAGVVKAFGAGDDAAKVFVHAALAQWNLSEYDPWVNILRTTTEALSGVLGGVDSLEVPPFDAAVRQPDDFSRRIARNLHLILAEESHFYKVHDPAAGSGLVESLTATLIEKATELVRAIETEGGMAKALEAGTPQARVREIAKKRVQNARTRKNVYVGVNMFPNLQEKPLDSNPVNLPDNLDALPAMPADFQPVWTVENMAQAYAQGATVGMLGKLNHPAPTPTKIEPLEPFHVLEPIEQLRRDIEGLTRRPQVFLANMGPLSQHKARADFSAGFFAVGGFETICPQGFPTPEEAADAAAASGAGIAVICSTDDTYPTLVPPFTQRLKEKNPHMAIVLAGYPKDQIAAHQAAGVDAFIHVRADVPQTLTDLAKRIGVLS